MMTTNSAKLIHAIYDGDVKRVKRAIADGAYVNTQSAEGITSLMRAASAGQTDGTAA